MRQDGGEPVILTPQARNFWSPPQSTSESALLTKWNGQLYAVIGNQAEDGRWQIRIWWKPFVTFIWYGGLLVGLGSGDPGFAPWQRFLTIGGSVVGALLITGQLAFWGELLGRQPRLAHGTAIGQRILGGWLVAISLLMLVLGWVGPLTKSAG